MKLAPLAWTVVLIGAISACSIPKHPSSVGASVIVEPPTKASIWRGIASAADQSRIDRVGLAWQEALTEAKRKFPREVADEGALLKPRAALPYPQPTPGSYNCRLDQLGAPDDKSPSFQKYKPFFCYVLVDDKGELTIVKQTGSQRPAGRLWEDDDPNRMIFLGSLSLGDEKEPAAYGDDPDRDMAGIFERIAPFRWRLVIPYPRSGAKLEVFELTPSANQPE